MLGLSAGDRQMGTKRTGPGDGDTGLPIERRLRWSPAPFARQVTISNTIGLGFFREPQAGRMKRRLRIDL